MARSTLWAATPAWVAAVAAALFLLSALMLPTIRMGGSFAVMGDAGSPAVAAQNLLSAKFGIEGTPTLLLIAGNEEEVLRRAENLTAGLDSYRQSGALKSVFSPTQLLPSLRTQKQRAASLAQDRYECLRPAPWRTRCARTACALSLTGPTSINCADWAKTRSPSPWNLQRLTCLPACSTTACAEPRTASYVAAIAFYAAAPNVHDAIPDAVLDSWRKQFGPFVEFSFDKINRDLQTQVLRDSRRALLWTAAAILRSSILPSATGA